MMAFHVMKTLHVEIHIHMYIEISRQTDRQTKTATCILITLQSRKHHASRDERPAAQGQHRATDRHLHGCGVRILAPANAFHHHAHERAANRPIAVADSNKAPLPSL